MSKSKRKIIKWSDPIKPSVSQSFAGVKSVTDQRCIINNPQELYEQYLISEEDLREELENEVVEDFDDDFYEYEDRTDYGVDIALAGQMEPPEIRQRPRRR